MLGKSNVLIVGEVAATADWEARALGRMLSDPKNPDKVKTEPGWGFYKRGGSVVEAGFVFVLAARDDPVLHHRAPLAAASDVLEQ